jgi:hypothetical protein
VPGSQEISTFFRARSAPHLPKNRELHYKLDKEVHYLAVNRDSPRSLWAGPPSWWIRPSPPRTSMWTGRGRRKPGRRRG